MKVLLPREYVSHTQLSLWERSPESYRRKYILGEDGFENIQMRFGKMFAEALEAGKGSNFASDALLSRVRLYPRREVEVSALLKLSRNKVALFGILDGYDKRTDTLGEYKTGKMWSQRRVDDDEQITFYNLIKYLGTKKLYKKNVLHSVETIMQDGEIQFTGNVMSFVTKRKLTDVLKMKKRVEKFVIEVSKMMEKEIGSVV